MCWHAVLDMALWPYERPSCLGVNPSEQEPLEQDVQV